MILKFQIKILYQNKKSKLVLYPNGLNSPSASIPETVRTIGITAFAFNSDLIQVNLPREIQRIEAGAFEQCDSLTTINFPQGLSYIGEKAFYCCINLTDVLFPTSLSYFGDSAFECCQKIEKVIIPNSNAFIGKNAFNTNPEGTTISIESLQKASQSNQGDAPLDLSPTTNPQQNP